MRFASHLGQLRSALEWNYALWEELVDVVAGVTTLMMMWHCFWVIVLGVWSVVGSESTGQFRFTFVRSDCASTSAGVCGRVPKAA